MKLFLRYLRQRLPVCAAALAFSGIFALCFWLYHLPMQAVLYPMLLCLLLGLAVTIRDFLRVKHRRETLSRIRSVTDAVTARLSLPDTIENRDWQEILRLLSEEHCNFRTMTSQKYEDMVDYYTVWAHQIKTPIASMGLQLQEEDSALARSLRGDLNRVEQYVEMVMTFLRLDSGSTDYMIREYPHFTCRWCSPDCIWPLPSPLYRRSSGSSPTTTSLSASW